MLLSQFDYNLPDELIAQRPLGQRTASRLLSVPASGQFQDRHFYDLPTIIAPGDILIFNNTRVIPARLYGRKLSGGKVELLVERIESRSCALCHIRASKAPKLGALLVFEGETHAEVVGRNEGMFRLDFALDGSLMDYLERCGHMPLPPYIRREDDIVDQARYQTIYAKEAGAVAAPTAGLHFDTELLARLNNNGIKSGFVTLHVGAGTFQPVRAENIAEHTMHEEWVDVSPEVCTQIQTIREKGGKVIAVGTTVVRSLEAAASSGELQPFQGNTRIFIKPGYAFRVVDALITNFHLPCSTLLMLVCAFGGYDRVMGAYQHAIEQRYRFYSYGDAMYLEYAKSK